MIDRETLARIAKLNNLRPWQQEKHYVQTLVLTSLSEHPVVFKGGTYLWFFHGLNRFSEDLDFTTSGETPKEIDRTISENLRMFGVDNSVMRVSDDERSFSFRISAKGPLNTSSIDLCYVYVEVSKREKTIMKPLSVELNVEPYKLPVKILSGMALDEVASEKIRAICTRNRARDVYDLFYLIEKKGVNFDANIANEKLKYYRMDFNSALLGKKVKERKKSWKQELGPTVFGGLTDFESVAKAIENWI